MSAQLRICRFVSEGHDLACAAIREEVWRDFAERWKQASWRERWKLRAEIDAEVRRRIARQAPPDALY